MMAVGTLPFRYSFGENSIPAYLVQQPMGSIWRWITGRWLEKEGTCHGSIPSVKACYGCLSGHFLP